MVIIEVLYRRAERSCPMSWCAAQGQCAQCLWWDPECDSSICSPTKACSSCTLGKTQGVWSLLKILRNTDVVQQSCTLLWLLLVWATRCDGSKLIFLCWLFRWMWVSAPWRRCTYPLVDGCGTARHFFFVFYPLFGCQFRDVCKHHLKQCTVFVPLWESHHRFSLIQFATKNNLYIVSQNASHF